MGFALAHFSSTGALDGVATDHFGGPRSNHVEALLPTADDHVVAVGPASSSFAVARYTPALELDSTFGSGDGVVLADEEADADGVLDAAIVAGGAVLTASKTGEQDAVYFSRYTADGEPDTAFGTGGAVSTLLPAAGEIPLVCAGDVLENGHTVVVGQIESTNALYVARFGPTGAPDPTFGDGAGFVVLPAVVAGDPCDELDAPQALEVLPDGRVLITTYTSPWVRIASITAAGALDRSFADGDAVLTITAAQGPVHDIAVDVNGILLAGHGFGGMGVTHLTPTGDIDAGFGEDGTATAAPSVTWRATSVAVQADASPWRPARTTRTPTSSPAASASPLLGSSRQNPRLTRPCTTAGPGGATMPASWERETRSPRSSRPRLLRSSRTRRRSPPATTTPSPFCPTAGCGRGARGLAGRHPLSRTAPHRCSVSGIDDVVAIAAGPQHSLAVTEDGTVWGWGSNSGGQLTGDDSISFSATPIEVMSLNPTGVVDMAVAAGQYHSVALDSWGNVFVWGDVEYDALGDEHPPPEITEPIELEVYDVTAIASGAFHSFAVKADGTLWAWGDNVFGQRGTNGGDKQTPMQVPGFDEVTAIAAHTHTSLALEADGDVWTWGEDGYGPLREHDSPVRVSEVFNAIGIAAGGGHSLVLTGGGDVLAWGANHEGQLGDGTRQHREAPVQVSGLEDVTAIAAGRQHSLAIGVGTPGDGVERVTADVIGGETVSSDSEGDGATPEDPLETSITSPNAGTVSIEEPPTIDGEGDFSFVGRVAIISAPSATAADPLVIRFRIDESVYPDDWDLQWFTVNRNGVLVEDCTAPTAADPDPCVASLARLGDGDVEVVVRTSAGARGWSAGPGRRSTRAARTRWPRVRARPQRLRDRRGTRVQVVGWGHRSRQRHQGEADLHRRRRRRGRPRPARHRSHRLDRLRRDDGDGRQPPAAGLAVRRDRPGQPPGQHPRRVHRPRPPRHPHRARPLGRRK